MKRFLLPLLCGLPVFLLADAAHLRAAAAEALALCAASVIPALFPFMAVSGMLVSMGFGAWAAPLFSALMTPLFRLPGAAGSALLLGLVGGYPIGARTAADLFAAGALTREEAERLLAFCNNSNPVFLVSVLGSGVFGSARTGLCLWVIHVLSALLTGLLFRGGRTTARRSPPPSLSPAPLSFSAAFVSAVRSAAAAMLSVCAFVVFFYTLVSPLRALGGRTAMAAVGLVELFSLTPLLTADHFGLVLASGCAGWGGLSVLAQTAAVLEGSGLSLRPCVAGKAVQGLLAAGLAAVCAPWLIG